MGVLTCAALSAASFWWRSTHVVAPETSVQEPVADERERLPAVTAGSDIERLRARRLVLPVQGYDPRHLRDGFLEARGTRVHAAIDLMAPRGTPVRAVDDGSVRKLMTSPRAGLSLYQFDLEGRYCYFYAHLDRYAAFLTEGKRVRKGEVVGYVGTTGNAPAHAPHLHFAIFKLEADQRWWAGRPINPYGLWASAVE